MSAERTVEKLHDLGILGEAGTCFRVTEELRIRLGEEAVEPHSEELGLGPDVTDERQYLIDRYLHDDKPTPTNPSA